MAEHIEHGAYEIPWTGTRVETGETVPGIGTWEVVDHDGCPGDGALRELGRGDEAPPCPVCATPITWQLSHLATSVAADHRGVGHLP
jgi:hypothetical protein